MVLIIALLLTFDSRIPEPLAELPRLAQWAYLPTIAISAGVLVALLSFERERRKHESENERMRSRIFLERAASAFEAVCRLLGNRNNDRMTWVRAARTLLRAVQLGKKIRDPDYKLAYELEADRARNDLYNSLTSADELTGVRSPLPPQFFYGIPDWWKYETLDEAAVKASSSINVYSMSIDKLPPQPHLKQLSPRSIVAIYDFLEYPNDYEDLLDSVDTWGDKWQDSHGVDQGARRYVAHADSTFAIDGKLHKKDSR
ncbi:MAG: hypothetical protein WD081_03810 [Gammaproteobacteria bacterium]